MLFNFKVKQERMTTATKEDWKSPECLFCAVVHIKEFGRRELNKGVFSICQEQQERKLKPEQRELGVRKTVKPFMVELYFLTTYAFNKVKIFDCNLHSIHLKVNN